MKRFLKCTGANGTIFYLVRMAPTKWSTAAGISLGYHKALEVTGEEASAVIAGCKEDAVLARFVYELVTPFA